MPDQVSALARSAGVNHDPDARPHCKVPFGDADRLREALQQSIAKPDGDKLVRTFEQQRELVAAEASHGIAWPSDVGEALCDLFEQLVARVVTQTVVHLLEL